MTAVVACSAKPQARIRDFNLVVVRTHSGIVSNMP